MSTHSGARLGYVDALRGIAALCVLVQHGAIAIAKHVAVGSPAQAILSGQWFDLGRFGVLLFFFISGFVIPFSLKGEKPLYRFAVGRFFRLYPPFWLSVVMTALVAWGTAGTIFPPLRLLANLTMAPVLFHQVYISLVYWTLFIELIFYGACFVLFAAGLLRDARAILAVGLVCVAIPLAGCLLRGAGHAVPVLYLTEHLSFLFSGTLIRMATLGEHPRARVYAAILVIAQLAAMPILQMQPDHSFSISTPLGVLLSGVAALAVFAWANAHPFAPTRPLLWLGTISYSVYLFHTPIGAVIDRLLAPADATDATLVLVLMLVATILFASLVYRLLEHPSIDLGRRLTRAPRETLAMDVAP